MKIEKKYFSIREVSQKLDIKEHVIRHWDSVDPKTNKLRIANLSIRTKGGTRFFNKIHIKKLFNLKNLLKENGKRIYSLDIASKIISTNKFVINSIDSDNFRSSNSEIFDQTNKYAKIRLISNNLKKLINLK